MANKEEDYINFFEKLASADNANATPKSRPSGASLPSPEPPPTSNAIVTPQQPKAIPSIPEYHNHYLSKKNYEVYEIEELPLGKFYHAGTKFEFRECDTREIEAYSMLDESSLYDFKEKIFELLSSCIRVKNPDGSIGSAADIKDGDKHWFVLLIREKTFINGKKLSVTVREKNNEGVEEAHEIEIVRANIEFYDNADIMQYYDNDTRCFVFHTELQADPIFICPPTVGLKRCFDHYLRLKVSNGLPADKINEGFFKFAPYLLPHISSMTHEELTEMEEWFNSEMSPDYFSFLHDLLINHMNIGIRGLKKKVGVREFRTNQIFPSRLKSLFVLPNAFSVFLKK